MLTNAFSKQLALLIILNLLAVATVLSASENTQTESQVPLSESKADSLIRLIKINKCGSDSLVFVHFQKAIRVSKKGAHQKQEADSYKQYALHLKCKSHFKKADSINRLAIAAAAKIDDPKFLATIYNNNISVLSSLGDHTTSIAFGKKALALLGTDPDPLYVVNINQNLTEPYIRLGYMDSATMCVLAGQKIAEKSADKALLAKATSSLGLVYYKRNMLPEAIEATRKGADLSLEIGDTLTYGNQIYRLGGFHRMNENFDQAEKAIKESISIFEKYQNNYYLVYAYSGLGDIYYQKDQLDLAISYGAKALNLAEKANMKDMQGVSLGNMGSAYLKADQPQKAIPALEKAISLLEEIQSKDLLRDCYKEYSKALGQVGRHAEALEIFQKYHDLEKEIYGVEKSKAVAELQTQYETEKKEAEIASLSQQAAIQALEIRQKNQGIMIGAIVLVFVGLGLWFLYQQRITRRKNQQTELEQRFLRSQLNPHFIANALLSVQQFILKNQAEVAATYLAKFSKLMREILENSRQEFIPVEDEVKMLTNYLDIHKVRLNDSFDYEVVVDEDIDTEADTIPPMFVQPFVENAIEHGIVNAAGRGKVTIRFTKDKDYIGISIQDNGAGLSQTTHSAQEHKSLSSTIIKERIDLFNLSLKKKIQLVLDDIKNEQGQIMGTQVELKVPFNYV